MTDYATRDLPSAFEVIHRVVGVDSGTVWIGDPCYLIGEPRGQSYENYLELRRMDGLGNADEPFGEGMGVAVTSGCGDGVYEVTVGTGPDGRVQWAFVDFRDES